MKQPFGREGYPLVWRVMVEGVWLDIEESGEKRLTFSKNGAASALFFGLIEGQVGSLE